MQVRATRRSARSSAAPTTRPTTLASTRARPASRCSRRGSGSRTRTSAPTRRGSSRRRSRCSTTRVRRAAPHAAGRSSNCGQQQQQHRFVVPRSASHAPLPSPPPLPGAVPTSGYISLIIPFFSTHLLPEEKGHWSEVTDYRLYMYNVSSGASPVNYLCVRLSFNGEHVHQVVVPPRCDCTHAQSTPNARPMRSHAQLASAMGMQ